MTPDPLALELWKLATTFTDHYEFMDAATSILARARAEETERNADFIQFGGAPISVDTAAARLRDRAAADLRKVSDGK